MKKNVSFIVILICILQFVCSQAQADSYVELYQQCKVNLKKCSVANTRTDDMSISSCLEDTLEHLAACHQTWNKIVELGAPFFRLGGVVVIPETPDFYLLTYEGQNVSQESIFVDDVILTPQGELIDISGFSYATVDFAKMEQLNVADLEKILPSFVKSDIAQSTVNYKFSKIDNQMVLIINTLIASAALKENARGYVQRTYTFDANSKIVNLHYAFFPLKKP